MTTTHEWGPSRLNHGNAQCKHCHCTDLEALHAIGPECPARKVTRPKLRLIIGGKGGTVGFD